MASHSSTLAWRIPGTEEPGGLQSMGSQRVRHDWPTGQKQAYTMEYYSIKKKEIPPFATTLIDLESVRLSEVSQRQINIIWYHLYVESKKKVQMNLFTKQKESCSVDNKLTVTGRGRGEGSTGRWGLISTHTTYKTVTTERLLHNTAICTQHPLMTIWGKNLFNVWRYIYVTLLTPKTF